jgi:hypothetical protein
MRTERRTKQEWQAILADQQASGLTVERIICVTDMLRS